MVATRSTGPEPSAKAEQHDDTTEPAVDASGLHDDAAPTSQKRKEAPTDEKNDNKRRQTASPEGDGEKLKVEAQAEDQKTSTHDAAKIETAFEDVKSDPGIVKSEHEELSRVSRELLKTFTHTTFEYLTQIVSRPGSRKGKEYRILYERFKGARTGLPTRNNFVDATKEGLSEHSAFVRRVNTVTFAASMLGSRDASFRQLNEHFFEIFVGKSGRLLKQPAEILLGLKTQAYISQAVETKGLREDILNDLFPSDMKKKLLALRPDSASGNLVDSEQNFIRQLAKRRQSLSEKETAESIYALREKYKWNEVLTNMVGYIKQHFQELVEIPAHQIHWLNADGEEKIDILDMPSPAPGKNGPLLHGPLTATPVTSKSTQQLSSQPQLAHQTPVQQGAHTISQGQQVIANAPMEQASADASNPAKFEGGVTIGSIGEDSDSLDDILSKALSGAVSAAEEASRSMLPYQQSPNGTPVSYSFPTSQAGQSAPIPPQYTLPQYSQHPNNMSASNVQMQTHSNGQDNLPSDVDIGEQSQPTHQLYELARQATTGRSSQPAPRRTGTQSQRRPWTTEEEQALMQGLDHVKGPHWSMILQLYGPNGKISEVLKDRNQVQLKDKARNLKLWFLKSGVEVPVNLKSVTGELKTRAPAAVRNFQQQTGPNGQHSQSRGPLNYAPSTNAYAPTSPNVYAPTTPGATATAGDFEQMLPGGGPADMGPGSMQLTDDPSDFWNDEAATAAAVAAAELQSLLGVESGQVTDLDKVFASVGGASNPSLGDVQISDASAIPPVKAEMGLEGTENVETGVDIKVAEDVVNTALDGTSANERVQTEATVFDPGIKSAEEPRTDQDLATVAAVEENKGEGMAFDEDEIARAAEQAAALAAESFTL